MFDSGIGQPEDDRLPYEAIRSPAAEGDTRASAGDDLHPPSTKRASSWRTKMPTSIVVRETKRASWSAAVFVVAFVAVLFLSLLIDIVSPHPTEAASELDLEAAYIAGL